MKQKKQHIRKETVNVARFSQRFFFLFFYQFGSRNVSCEKSKPRKNCVFLKMREKSLYGAKYKFDAKIKRQVLVGCMHEIPYSPNHLYFWS